MKMLIVLSIVVAVVGGGAAASSAQRDIDNRLKLNDVSVGKSKYELKEQIRHSANVIEFFNNHKKLLMPSRKNCRVVLGIRSSVCLHARQVLRAHTWLKKVAADRLQVIRAQERKAALENNWNAYRQSIIAPYLGWLAKVRNCESHSNYSTNTGNGFYGAYQFVPSTWTGVGGVGMPHEASPLEQDYRAVILYKQSGSSPWPVCG